VPETAMLLYSTQIQDARSSLDYT